MASETTRLRKEKDFNYPLAVLIFVAVTVLVIILSLKLNDSAFKFSNQVAIKDNMPAPDFTFPGLDGKMVSLSDYKGKVVLLNIWATWCPPCVEEMPSMEKLYQELKDEGFELLAVNVDESGAETVAPFMEKHKLGFPVLLDPKGDIKNLYLTTGIPESFIIDKDGIVVEKIIGPIDWATPKVFLFFQDLTKKART